MQLLGGMDQRLAKKCLLCEGECALSQRKAWAVRNHKVNEVGKVLPATPA